MKISSLQFCIALLLGLPLYFGRANAQQSAPAGLPDTPIPRQSIFSNGPSTPAEHTDPQTKRILDIFPNFRAVSAETHLPPQPVREKFITASEDSFDYSAFVLPAALAGESEAANDTPEFGSGGVGYGRYLWHTIWTRPARTTGSSYHPHADPGRYTLLHTGARWRRALKRIGYSMSRIVITRTDSGHDTFNISEVVGAGAAAGVSNLYYPRPERTLSNTADKWAVNVGVDSAGFLVREFWPDINHFLFHGKQPMATH